MGRVLMGSSAEPCARRHLWPTGLKQNGPFRLKMLPSVALSHPRGIRRCGMRRPCGRPNTHISRAPTDDGAPQGNCAKAPACPNTGSPRSQDSNVRLLMAAHGRATGDRTSGRESRDRPPRHEHVRRLQDRCWTMPQRQAQAAMHPSGRECCVQRAAAPNTPAPGISVPIGRPAGGAAAETSRQSGPRTDSATDARAILPMLAAHRRAAAPQQAARVAGVAQPLRHVPAWRAPGRYRR